MTRQPLLIAIGGAAIASLAALWLLPPVGFVACMVLLVIAPPWGRTLSERAIISGVVMMGAIAVAFPRAGSTPVSSTSARLALSVLIVAVVLLRLVPQLRQAPIPRPTWSDGIVAALAAVSAFWMMSAYIGRNVYEVVSGLFFSGWDNQAHFTTFANTYVVGSTTWPTVDGSIAWNQWYPSLHTTMWSLAEYAMRGSTAAGRTDLLWPFVQWSALSFGLCMAALAWVGGDLAARLGGRDRERWTRPLAAGAVAAFALLGTPAYLFNMGFTNFVMGVTVVVVVAYLSARSWRSARVLGWFLIPLGGLVVIGLWTPLALGLLPSAVIVAIAILKANRWWGIAWLVGCAALAGFLVLTQMSAILGVEPGTTAGDLTTDLGRVGTGMSSFNLGVALAAPVVAGLLAVLLITRHQTPLALAVLGPILGCLVIAVIFMQGADAANLGRLHSYYVLKPMNGMLLAVAPIIAALVSVALVRALAGVPRPTAILSAAMGAVIVVSMFGYVGVLVSFDTGYSAAPGIQAGANRAHSVDDSLVGEAIIRGRDASLPYPEYTSLLWDGAGTLPNLWVASLREVMSKKQQSFYRNLPSFPYDDKTAQYVSLALNLDADLTVAVLWFRPPSGELLQGYVNERGDDRVVLVQVPMPSNDLCKECSL